MTARGTVMPYFGLPSLINGNNDLYTASRVFGRADELILQVPFGVTNNVIIINSETSNFFEVVRLLNKPVWIRIGAYGSYNSGTAAVAGIIDRMALYYTWFQQYLMLDFLKGFYIEDFGFEKVYATASDDHLTRKQQNDIVTAAHITYGLPVFVQCYYPGDALTMVGPSYGAEDRVPLWPPVFGRTPGITDWIMLKNPIISSWSGATPTYDKSRIADFTSFAKQVLTNEPYVKVAAYQQFSLSSSSADELMGLTVDSAIATIMNDFALFMRNVGFGKLGAADVTDGRTSNLAIDPIYLNNDGALDNLTGYSSLWSVGAQYKTTNKTLEENQTSTFNNQYKLQGS